MPLSVEQVRELSALADRWLEGDATLRHTLEQQARAQGEDFALAFAAMVTQLQAEHSHTLLPPIPAAMREAAVDAAMEQPTAVASTTRLPNSLDGPAPQPKPREAGQHVGPYRLVKELGRGGMGVVWLAERADGQHTRQVALKMPLVENLNWLLAARFARERNILASLEHPRIARLYDAGMDEGTQPYIAIEYVQGLPITHYVKAHKLRPEAVVVLFAKVIEAEQYEKFLGRKYVGTKRFGLDGGEAMIPATVRIFVCTQPQDMRRSFDGLALATRQVLGQDPRSGALFVFANRRCRQLRVLWWDGSGYNLLCRRLHQALFRLPTPGDPSDRSVVVDQHALQELLRGVPTARRRT